MYNVQKKFSCKKNNLLYYCFIGKNAERSIFWLIFSCENLT
jgi:hypothetical protein